MLKPVIKAEWCKACGICVAFCPEEVFEADAYGRPVVKMGENCSGCKLCQYRCPDFAITLVEAE